MEEFERRLIFGLSFFFIGVHAVALGIYWNGTNTKANPAWIFLSSLLSLEWLLLKAAIIIFIVVIVFYIWGSAVIVSGSNSKSVEPKPALTPPSPVIVTPPKRIEVVKIDETPLPIPAPPTPEELKEKAIKQILRGY